MKLYNVNKCIKGHHDTSVSRILFITEGFDSFDTSETSGGGWLQSNSEREDGCSLD